jgi:hypothetical protein
MTARELRTRAAAHDDVADKLAEMASTLTGKLQHLRKVGAWEEARVVEIRLSAAIRGEERALLRAMGCRLAAARIEQHAAMTAALVEVAA